MAGHTLGGGNHFVELQADDNNRLWLMIHSGSRAMGQAVRARYVALGRKTTGLIALDADSQAGAAYLADMSCARAYADVNRRAMVDQVVGVMSNLFSIHADQAQTVTCDHNHLAHEQHGGEMLCVHRKGAMPAGDGVAGICPGSMGTLSYHVQGRGNPDALRVVLRELPPT